MNLSQETTRQLLGFGLGVVSAPTFEEWIIASQDDEELLDSEQVIVRELRLLLLEYGEGSRELSEVQSFAWGLLLQNGSPILATNSNVTTEIFGLVTPRESLAPAP
jgi:hypothetical protein